MRIGGPPCRLDHRMVLIATAAGSFAILAGYFTWMTSVFVVFPAFQPKSCLRNIGLCPVEGAILLASIAPRSRFDGG